MLGIRILLHTSIALLLLAAASHAEEDIWKAESPFDSAIIHYEISGSQKGEETLYIRKSGEERARVTRSSGKTLFITTKTNTIEIVTPETMINIDMDKKSGTKVTNPRKFMIEEYDKLSSKEKATVRENMKKIGIKGGSMIKSMGGEIKPKAGEWLGYTCDIISFMGTTVYQMSGTAIPLKSDASMMGISIKTVATKLEKNAAPPKGVFEIPAGVDVQFNKEQDDINREMAKSMIDWLKDPEAEKKMTRMEQDVEKAKREAEQERAAEERGAKQGGEEQAPAKDEEGQGKTDEMMKKGMDALKGLFK